MKTTLFGRLSNRAGLLVVLVVSLVSTVQLQAQQSTSIVDLAKNMKESLVKTLNGLSSNWDQAGYSLSVRSAALTKSMAEGSSEPSSFAIFSFKGNVESVTDKEANEELKTMATLLRKAIDELNEVSEQKKDDGKLKQLKPLLKYLGFSVSNMPVNVNKLDVSCSKVAKLTMAESYLNGLVGEAVTQATEEMAQSSNSALSKHNAYKYLAASVLSIPSIWTILEPEFSRLAKVGGAITDNLTFAKLYMERIPYFADDSRIWKEAPRFYRSQLKESKSLPKIGDITRVEVTDKETRVTTTIRVSSHEVWFRLDENSVLVDNETKERYPIKGMADGLPVGKTFVVVGCEGLTMENTLIFPPVKKSLKSFYIEEVIPYQTSEKARLDYRRKHNIMSDGDGASINKTVYQLDDFLK